RWLVTGSWNPVSRPSTAWTPRSGFTKSRVKPVRGRNPSGVQADSKALTTVVPTAITRSPFVCVRFTASAESAEMAKGSGYIACASTVSVSISRLETPVWSRMGAMRTPACSSCSRIRGEARGNRRALVDDQEVTGAQEPRQVLEARVVLAVGPGDEEADVVAGATANLRGFVGEDAFGSLEHELGAPHAATSHTAACA